MEDGGKCRRIIAKLFGVIGQVHLGPDDADRHACGQPVAPDARVQHSRLDPRVAADDQQRIRLVNAGDGRIEQIAGTHAADLRTVLTAVDAGASQLVEQGLQGKHGFGVALVAGDGSNGIRLGLL